MLEIFNWTKRVINSCDTFLQLVNSKKLIERYRVIYGNGVHYKRLMTHHRIHSEFILKKQL